MSRTKTPSTQTPWVDVPAKDRRPGQPSGPGYARLSKAPDGSLVAVADQITAQVRTAHQNGLDLRRVYFDNDLSAWSGINRPGWDAYLADLRTSGAEFASSYHSDRLARNGPDGEAFLTVMTTKGLPLVTPGQTLDLGTNSDARFMQRMLFAVAIKSSDDTSRRLKDRKAEARAKGQLRYVLGGTPPVGFMDGADEWQTDPLHRKALGEVAALILADDKHRLTPALAEVQAAWAAEGQAWITTNPSNSKPKSGGQPVSEKMIRAALRRPITAGLMPDGKGKANLVGPAPLDELTWRRLQRVFRDRSRGGREAGTQGEYPYTYGPAARCGKCGNQLTGGRHYYRGTSKPVYACKNPHPNMVGLDGQPILTACRGVSVDAVEFDAMVDEATQTWAKAAPSWLASDDQGDELATRLADLQGQLLEVRAWLKGLRDDRLARIIEPWEYDQEAPAYKAQIASLMAEASQVQAAMDEPQAPSAEQVAQDWQAMTPADRLATVQRAFSPIIVSPGKGGPGQPSLKDSGRVLIEVRKEGQAAA